MRLQVGLSSMLQGLSGRHSARLRNEPEESAHTLQLEIATAHREWQAAQQYFQVVSDPELVDHAIFNLEAAQRKYMYLFRRMRDGRTGNSNQEA